AGPVTGFLRPTGRQRRAWGRSHRRRAFLLAGAVVFEALRYGKALVQPGVLVAAALAVLLVAVVPPLRWRARVLVGGLWMRHRFMASARDAGLVNRNNRVPSPVKIRPIPVGHVLRVRLAAGSHAGELETAAPAL